MKNLILIPLFTLAATTATASDVVNATIKDHYINSTVSEPYTARVCNNVEVPVYGTRTRQGDAAGSALLGMIIGGAAGKAITGKDNGAAAGAIMGGIIGADKGSQLKTEQVITGYRTERQCSDVTQYRDKTVRTYDYSSISWWDNGKKYEFTFVKNQ